MFAVLSVIGCEGKEAKNARIEAECKKYVQEQYDKFKSACYQEPVAIACPNLNSSCMSKFRGLSSSEKTALCEEKVESQSKSWDAREAVNACKKESGYEYGS